MSLEKAKPGEASEPQSMPTSPQKIEKPKVNFDKLAPKNVSTTTKQTEDQSLTKQEQINEGEAIQQKDMSRLKFLNVATPKYERAISEQNRILRPA